MRPALFAPLAALALVTPAAAQRREATPEQRIERLEKQVRQVQGRIFPKGQPADTAGFNDDPAATLTQANQLSNRLDSIEKQMAELTRMAEENGNRVATLEADLARLRAEQDSRFKALENPAARQPAEGGTTAASETEPEPERLVSQPKVEKPAARTAANDSGADDPGEEAYTQGFKLWEAKKYSQAITSLRAFTSGFKGHRRVSWANNLIGRSLLDSGQPRAAAEALLANYRADPKGERAPDSLYYLGKSLMKLGQPTQACKAYAELDDVYGSSMRPALRQLLPAARAEAKCS